MRNMISKLKTFGYLVVVLIVLSICKTGAMHTDILAMESDSRTPNTFNNCVPPRNAMELKAEALQQVYNNFLPFDISTGNTEFNLTEGTIRDTIGLVAKVNEVNSCPFSKKGRSAVLTEHVKDGEDIIEEPQESCPFHFQKDFETERVPELINQVKCSCEKCIEPTGKRCEKDGTGCLKFSGSCVSIVTPFPVIRRTCAEGELFYEYYGDIEYISVGCVCRRDFTVKR